jgi:hypothetical protein
LFLFATAILGLARIGTGLDLQRLTTLEKLGAIVLAVALGLIFLDRLIDTVGKRVFAPQQVTKAGPPMNLTQQEASLLKETQPDDVNSAEEMRPPNKGSNKGSVPNKSSF